MVSVISSYIYKRIILFSIRECLFRKDLNLKHLKNLSSCLISGSVQFFINLPPAESTQNNRIDSKPNKWITEPILTCDRINSKLMTFWLCFCYWFFVLDGYLKLIVNVDEETSRNLLLINVHEQSFNKSSRKQSTHMVIDEDTKKA